MTLGERFVAAVIRCYPSSFRARFGGEMLSAFLDQRDALAARHGKLAPAVVRHTVSTLAGLLRAVVAVHVEERGRHATWQPHRSYTEKSASMRRLATDARYALRTLRASPMFATVAVLTLALGIGATTAVFSVLNSVVLAPLPYDEPAQLVRIYSADRGQPDDKEFLTRYDVAELRDKVRAFSTVAVMNIYRETGGDLQWPDGSAQRVSVVPVSADYFATLRATPLIGRTFTREEERPDVRRAILSHGLWSDLTGGDSSMAGRTLVLNGERFDVVGVMRERFSDVVAGDAALWVPVNMQQRAGDNSRWNQYASAIARLRPGVSVQQAQAQVDALMAQLGEQFPDSHRERRARVVPLHDDVVGASRSPVYVLMGAAGLVLLIACVNVANLSLVRSTSRARETSIRTALGASGSRLIGQQLAESLMVAVTGGSVGSAVAYSGVKMLLAVSPQSLARAESVHFDTRLLGFAMFVTVVTGLLFGVVPAVRMSRANPSDAMRDGTRGNSSGRASRRIHSTLVASQISLAVVLLVGAGLLIRSFVARQRVDLGFDAARVATFEVHLPVVRYDSPDRRVQFHAAYREHLRALPGVVRIGATSWLPANGGYHGWGFNYLNDAGQEARVSAQVRVIEGDFLEAMNIPLLTGRRFGQGDRLGTQRVALISRSVATRAYGNRDPMGRQFRTGGTEFVVAGVVGDVANDVVGAEMETVYLSHAQFADNRNWALTYVVKTSGDDDAVINPARQALSAIDPALVLYKPRPMDTVLARHRARDRFTLLLMATFAGVALSLAAVGVYGVLSYAVTQRTHEIGVRMALGARAGQVRAIVMTQALRVAGIGVSVGIAGAFVLSGLLRSLIFGVSTHDVTVFAVVTVVLGAVVMLSAYVPARQATRVDPLATLRGD